MSSWAKYREFVRIPPRRKAEAEKQTNARIHTRRCEWPGCKAKGSHRAPKDRHTDKPGYRWFCLDHVREFNRSWNYFEGMSDEEAARFREEALTGHRPTWKVGANAGASAAARFGFMGSEADPHIHDAHGFMHDGGTRADAESGARRRLRPREVKALETLGLDATATADDIRGNYKRLVKLHHPDANGGDRSSEDRLQSVIEAYGYLKSTGYC